MSFSLSAGIAITLPVTAAIDLELYRLSTFTGFTTTLVNSIGASDSSLVLAGAITQNITAQTVMIDNEPIQLAGQVVSGNTTSFSISRAWFNTLINAYAGAANLYPFTAMAAASHSAGATVKLCNYNKCSWMIGALYYNLLTNTVLPALGANSATIGTTLAAQQAAQATYSSDTTSSSLAYSTS